MSKARVVVLEVLSGNLTVSAAARNYGMSRQHIHRLLKRYREGGIEAVDPRSRRPASNPRAVSDEVIAAIVTLREQLTADGLDTGPLTQEFLPPLCRRPTQRMLAIRLHPLDTR